MMHMTFYWSKEVTLLVDFWSTSTWLSYASTLAACFLFSAFYQFLEHRRVALTLHLSKPSSSSSSSSTDAAPIETPLLVSKPAGKKWSLARAATAALFGLNAAVGYLLMLAVMSFNGGVFVSIVCGLATGYLVFRSGGDESTSDLAVVENPVACCA